ncbi:hypothetical protein [Thioalkalivibrio sp. ALgr1]|uniref:hypothetical protein n=1 Tax=Thioalkalivibrio sp. ALgr1 TaxID=748655 RepID=UPI0018DC00ED|nr:hypothetical protein [Thioalkalivibrio sp. ALgr1]
MSAISSSAVIILNSQLLSYGDGDLKEQFQSLERCLGPYGMSVANHFSGMLLSSVITEVESYLVDVTKHLLQCYPKKIGHMEFALRDIIDKPKEEMVLMAAEEHLHGLMYGRPMEYLDKLTELMSIEAEPVKTHWAAFIEAKARRDLGVHNNWKINSIYRRKVQEAGLAVSEPESGFLWPDHNYLRGTMGECDKLVESIADQLELKFAPSPE